MENYSIEGWGIKYGSPSTSKTLSYTMFIPESTVFTFNCTAIGKTATSRFLNLKFHIDNNKNNGY